MAVNPEKYHTGDGSKTSFDLDFEYIDETDVKVSVDGTVRPTTEYSFANATTILFDTAPDADTEVRIYRDTNVDELKSTFFAGSSIRAQDLNQNFEQNNFAVQEIKAYTWDNETQTIHSDETWVSSDAQIATTAAMDQRFQDEAQDTLTKAELDALSDVIPDNDDAVPTTGAVKDYVDHVIETDILVDGTGLNKTGASGQVTIGISAGSVDLDRIKPADIVDSTETWSATDTQVATTQAIEDRIDEIITNDIGTDGTGITVTDDGDGTITLGLANNSIDLARIKNADIITSGETDPDNDVTIATTAKIGDMIDVAIANDITSDGSGVTVTDDGDGTITLSVEEGALNLNRINAGNIVTESEQDGGATENDTTIFTTLAAAKRFDTLVQTANPGLTGNWETGKTWLQNDDDLTLSVWNGTGWVAITSGGTFTSQPNVVYVDKASGDDNNNGHRISTPKASITSAIDQINGEISLSTDTDEGFNGGSGYVDATYSNVSLTHSSGTGIGTGLTASITVSSGVVTAITLSAAQQTTLEEYSIGDVLTASNADLGGSGSGLLIPITGAGDGQIVVVSAGVYQEAAPIQIKRRNVSIIGQALRSCLVHPTVATENNNLFELNSGSYISNLTLTGVQAGTGTGNTLDATLPTTQGWNFAFYDGAYIVKSPYIQNCTNFSDSEIDNSDLLAHRPRGGAAGDTDSAPTGGGMLVNGATPADDSPLRSMVADSYTHVGLNGPGILVTNNGYAQITSSYAFFNKYHIKCLNGGQANLAASTTDFGDQALVADGKSTTAIFTADLSTGASDGDITFTIDAPTADASWHGSATRPQGNMLVDVDGTIYPILSATANGSGWDVTISRPNPNNRSENLGLDGAITTPLTVSFYLRSMVASSGHTMEYVGSGTNYSALPENGGVPDETKQITESNNGKVWTAITDHNGKFKIGGNQTTDPIFEVDQQLGFVTIPEGSIAFNLLSDLTPQLGGNLDVNGQTITSASNGNIVIDPDGTGIIELGSNVGVGTATPANTLDVTSANTTISSTSTGNSTAKIALNSNRAASVINTQILGQWNGNTVARIDFINGADDVNKDDGSISFLTANNSSNPLPRMSIAQNGDVAIDTNTLYVDATNNRVGVGTSAPDTRLTVDSSTIDQAVHVISSDSNVRIKLTDGDATNSVFIAGKGDNLAFETAGNNERVRIDSSGRLLMGSPISYTTSTSSTLAPLFQVHNTGLNQAQISINSWATGTNAGGSLSLCRSDSGTVGTHTAIGSADYLGNIRFSGSDGTKFLEGAKISAYADGTTWAEDAGPTNLAFFTTATDTAVQRMTIDSSGNVGIGTANPALGPLHLHSSGTDARLHITNSNTGTTSSDGFTLEQTSATTIFNNRESGSMRFHTAGIERARFDSSGRLLVGTPTSRSNFYNTTASAGIQLEGSSTSRRLSIISDENQATGPATIILGLQKSGSVGGNTVVGNGDMVGAVSFMGNDGSEFVEAATIIAHVDGTPGSNDMPGRLVFSTTADGASSPTERLRINSNGAWGIEGANYGTSGQVLTSNGNDSPTWQDAAAGGGAGSVEAWIAFDGGSGSIGTGDGSGNVDGVTDNGTGDYTIDFTTDLANANYCVSIDMANTNSDFASLMQITSRGGPDCCVHGTTRPTTAAVRVTSFFGSSGTGNGGTADAFIYVACIL